MSIVLQSSGGGSVTIAEPATASNFTATLPASTGTILTTGTPQSGGVIQVVNATLAAGTTLTNSTWTNVNLTASITPKFSNSKIVAFGQIFMQISSTNQPEITLYRDGTNLLSAYSEGFCSIYSASGGYTELNVPFSYQDSPATTSATTYSIYGRLAGGSSTTYGSTARLSVITLMEIAA